jgi:hypothetical protein
VLKHFMKRSLYEISGPYQRAAAHSTTLICATRSTKSRLPILGVLNHHVAISLFGPRMTTGTVFTIELPNISKANVIQTAEKDSNILFVDMFELDKPVQFLSAWKMNAVNFFDYDQTLMLMVYPIPEAYLKMPFMGFCLTCVGFVYVKRNPKFSTASTNWAVPWNIVSAKNSPVCKLIRKTWKKRT